MVMIKDSELAETLQTTRLRLQILTLVRSVATEVLDTTGIQTAVDHIRSGCPASPEADTITQRSSPPENLCSEQWVARLRAAGVIDQQTNAACRH